jgi:hypothetical protein
VEALRRVFYNSLPAKKIEVAATQTATAGLQNPVKSFFQTIANAHTSKVDGAAVRAARRKQNQFGTEHHCGRS